MRFLGWILIVLLAQPVGAQTETSTEDLTQRLDALEREVRELKAAPVPVPPAPAPMPVPKDPDALTAADPAARFTFLGPAVSKIYFHPEARWQFGLDSEFFSFTRQGAGSRLNVTNLAPTFALRLHRRLIFNSQILLENGGAESSNTVTLRKGQVIVQMAYLDWMFADDQQGGMRVGHQLIPVGQINTLNEPTTYFSVLRPELERELIPSSWHENGLLFWVDRPRATLEAGVFNSLDAAGFRQETFLAGGRSQGQNAKASNVMGVFRLHAKLEHVLIGGSLAFGNTDQGSAALRSGAFQLSELHLRLHWSRFEASMIGATGQIQDADAISIINSTTFPQQARGSSFQIAGELLGQDQKLWVFSRFSQYNLHDQVPDGFTADPSLNKKYLTTGLAYFPLPTLAIKADYQRLKTAADSRSSDGFNLGLGLIF